MPNKEPRVPSRCADTCSEQYKLVYIIFTSDQKSRLTDKAIASERVVRSEAPLSSLRLYPFSCAGAWNTELLLLGTRACASTLERCESINKQLLTMVRPSKSFKSVFKDRDSLIPASNPCPRVVNRMECI